MKSGYKIVWTNHAISELTQTIDYLKTNFTDKELIRLSLEIEKKLSLISKNPNLFQKSEIHNIER